MYRSIQPCTIHTSTMMYQYVLVCTSMYRYIQYFTLFFIPLFLAGNSTESTPTIPHKFSKHTGSGLPVGSADTADADGRRGSNEYEANTWLWLGKPLLGCLCVEETALRKGVARLEQVTRAVETRQRRRAAKAASKWSVWLMSIPVRTSTYQYMPVCTFLFPCIFLKIRHHPIISQAWEMYVVAIKSRSSSWMYEKP